MINGERFFKELGEVAENKRKELVVYFSCKTSYEDYMNAVTWITYYNKKSARSKYITTNFNSYKANEYKEQEGKYYQFKIKKRNDYNYDLDILINLVNREDIPEDSIIINSIEDMLKDNRYILKGFSFDKDECVMHTTKNEIFELIRRMKINNKKYVLHVDEYIVDENYIEWLIDTTSYDMTIKFNNDVYDIYILDELRELEEDDEEE